MRKITQRELLEANFLKKAIAGGAAVARAIAPEITDPLDKIERKVRTNLSNIKQSFKTGQDVGYGGTSPSLSRTQDGGKTPYIPNLQSGIEKQGLKYDSSRSPRFSYTDPSSNVDYYSVPVIDSGNKRKFIITDEDGNLPTS